MLKLGLEADDFFDEIVLPEIGSLGGLAAALKHNRIIAYP